jgi:hypothetical protein
VELIEKDATEVAQVEPRGFSRLKTAAMVSGGMLGVAALVPSGALAAAGDPPTVDYTKVTDGASDQITAALPVALALIGTVTAVFVGWKFISRLTGAKKPA